MSIFAIDPGTTKSGWVLMVEGEVVESGVDANEDVMKKVFMYAHHSSTLAVEMIASYGMTVGRETFETVLWTGRFFQHWLNACGGRCLKIYRQEAKRCVCKTHKASDADVRSALIARLGEVGTKKAPGPLYGVKSHAWAALAVAVTADEILRNPAVWKVEEVA